MFSALFAAYAVLSGNTAGGPSGRELFNLRNVFIETLCLLLSSYTCGLGMLSAERRQPAHFLIFALLTFVLGAAFLSSRSGIRRHGEAGRRVRHAAPFCPASSPWSACMAPTSPPASSGSSIWSRRFLPRACERPCCRRLLCFSLFWHALDIVWIGVMTLVYLMGAP